MLTLDWSHSELESTLPDEERSLGAKERLEEMYRSGQQSARLKVKVDAWVATGAAASTGRAPAAAVGRSRASAARDAVDVQGAKGSLAAGERARGSEGAAGVRGVGTAATGE